MLHTNITVISKCRLGYSSLVLVIREQLVLTLTWKKLDKLGAANLKSKSQLLPLKSMKRYDVTEIPIIVGAMSMYILAGVVYTIFFPLLSRS